LWWVKVTKSKSRSFGFAGKRSAQDDSQNGARSVCVPGFWDIDIGAIEVGDGRATEEPQRAVDVGAQNFDGAIDAGLSGSG
jgi:hypothetical protein